MQELVEINDVMAIDSYGVFLIQTRLQNSLRQCILHHAYHD